MLSNGYLRTPPVLGELAITLTKGEPYCESNADFACGRIGHAATITAGSGTQAIAPGDTVRVGDWSFSLESSYQTTSQGSCSALGDTSFGGFHVP